MLERGKGKKDRRRTSEKENKKVRYTMKTMLLTSVLTLSELLLPSMSAIIQLMLTRRPLLRSGQPKSGSKKYMLFDSNDLILSCYGRRRESPSCRVVDPPSLLLGHNQKSVGNHEQASSLAADKIFRPKARSLAASADNCARIGMARRRR
jgi:hypothetical protein